MYKRHQVIQVLNALSTGATSTARQRIEQPVRSELFTVVKRLLELDLGWARSNPDLLPRFGMAFYDALPSGTGADVSYSSFRVFCLAVARELVSFGGKQSEIVDLIAQIQGPLRAVFENENRVRETYGRTRFTHSNISTVSSDNREKFEDVKVFLALRRFEATVREEMESGSAIRVGEILHEHEILLGSAAVNNYIVNMVRNGKFAVFLIELSEIANRVVELLECAPTRRRGAATKL
ncbi:hypothetical protein [Methylobacterium sp. A54F]